MDARNEVESSIAAGDHFVCMSELPAAPYCEGASASRYRHLLLEQSGVVLVVFLCAKLPVPPAAGLTGLPLE